MLKRIAESLWGKFQSKEELARFLKLATIFGLIIGTYWTMRPMKDSIFNALVGAKQWLWTAKILSLFINVPLVILYTKLLEWFPRHKVFYLLTIVYAFLTFGFAWAFSTETIGLLNPETGAHRYIGWAWYVFVESFGSLVVALFWAITTDITKPEAAKRGFPIIVLFAQLANIVFPYFLTASKLGFQNSAPVVALCGGFMLVIGLLMWYFMHSTPQEELIGYPAGNVQSTEEEATEETGFLEGLKLLVTKGYLFGIFFIIGVYEFIVTIVDNHFKILVADEYAHLPKLIQESHVSGFLSKYAYTVGIVAFLCVLFGINNIQRKMGMKASLLMLPPLVALAIVMVRFNPANLLVAFWIMVFSKAVNYALNQPTIKQLYIPTTKDTKYKAQAWIETFGSRASKALGSLFAGLRPVLGVATFLTIAMAGSLALVGVWVLVAIYLAKNFDKAVKEDTVVC